MPTTTITDYQVLRDSNFTISRLTIVDNEFPQSKTFDFDIPSDLHLTNSTRRHASLAFKMRPLVDTKLTVRVNHNKLFENTFDASHTRAYWETFSMKSVLGSDANTASDVPVSFFCNTGRIVISDVILWYQIDR